MPTKETPSVWTQSLLEDTEKTIIKSKQQQD